MFMECDRCGMCCLNYSGTNWAKREELLRWYDQGRKDILRFVRASDASGRRRRGDELSREELGAIAVVHGWTDPETGREILPCPFLMAEEGGRYRCSIHAVKPETCRRFHHGDWELFVAYRELFRGAIE